LLYHISHSQYHTIYTNNDPSFYFLSSVSQGNFNIIGKNLTGLGCIKMSGIMMSIEGLDENTFQAPVSVLGFSHAST